MKKILLLFLAFFLYGMNLEESLQMDANCSTSNNLKKSNWVKFDKQFIYQTPKIPQEQSVDFKNFINTQFANILESGYNGEQTDANLDFSSQSLELKNLSTLYEFNQGVLLFQKELYLAQDISNYSGGLINRYEQNDFLLGANVFFDSQDNAQNHSFGGELGYSKFFKTYVNYYVPDDESKQRVSELGMSFVIPSYTPLGVDISKDYEKVNYKLTYTPYSIFTVSLARHDYNDLSPTTSVHFGFTLKYDKNFFKQLKKSENTLDEIHRYDYLQRNKYY